MTSVSKIFGVIAYYMICPAPRMREKRPLHKRAFLSSINYFAYSTLLNSRITLTLI